MKSVYILGISLAIGVVILYIQWQQKKKLEEMNALLTNLQIPQQQNVLDREFIVEENQRPNPGPRRDGAAGRRIHGRGD